MLRKFRCNFFVLYCALVEKRGTQTTSAKKRQLKRMITLWGYFSYAHHLPHNLCWYHNKKKKLDHLAKRRCEHWRLYPIDYLAHVKSLTLLSLTENICLLLSLTVSWEGETGAFNLSQERGRELVTWYAILSPSPLFLSKLVGWGAHVSSKFAHPHIYREEEFTAQWIEPKGS